MQCTLLISLFFQRIQFLQHFDRFRFIYSNSLNCLFHFFFNPNLSSFLQFLQQPMDRAWSWTFWDLLVEIPESAANNNIQVTIFFAYIRLNIVG
jgi:hypothetical protein